MQLPPQATTALITVAFGRRKVVGLVGATGLGATMGRFLKRLVGLGLCMR